MQSFICKNCNQKFDNEKKFHSHIVYKEKTKLESYFTQHYPRYDLYSGEPIKFKDKHQYFSADFLNRTNLIKWLKEKASPEEAKTYAVELLKDRKHEKEAVWAFSHCELKSILIPSIEYYEQTFGDYNQICESIGLKKRFDYHYKLEFDDLDTIIGVDNREQSPLIFPNIKTEKMTLNFGDYCCLNRQDKSRVVVERKSIQDLCGSISKGYERLQGELARAKEMNYYVILMCERPLKESLAIEYLPYLHTQVTSSFLWHRLRELLQKFDNMQLLFCDGRKDMSETIINLFKLKNDITKLDLQYIKAKREI